MDEPLQMLNLTDVKTRKRKTGVARCESTGSHYDHKVQETQILWPNNDLREIQNTTNVQPFCLVHIQEKNEVQRSAKRRRTS